VWIKRQASQCFNKYGDSVHSKPRGKISSLWLAELGSVLRGFPQCVLVNFEEVTQEKPRLQPCNFLIIHYPSIKIPFVAILSDIMTTSLKVPQKLLRYTFILCSFTSWKKPFIHTHVCVCVCARACTGALRAIRNVQPYGLTCTHQGHPITEMLQGKTELSSILPPSFCRWPDVLLDVSNQ
jgi:hypothetical protein